MPILPIVLTVTIMHTTQTQGGEKESSGCETIVF
jgi:hypothetical protein